MAIQEIAIQGINALTGLTNAIGGLVDKGQQVRYQQAISELSAQQQQELNSALLRTNSQSQRQQILASVLGQIGQARVNALTALQAQKQKTTTIVIVSIIGGIVLLGVTYLIIKKR